MAAGPGAVSRKIERAKEEATHRNLTRKELADTLEASLGSVDRWVKQGVPHDVAASAGGPGEAKLRLFDPDEVREWRITMHEEAAARRGGGYSQEIWDAVIEFLEEGNSLLEAAQKFDMSARGISYHLKRKKIEILGARSHRELTREQVAEILRISPHTVWTWTTQGAPFEKGRKGLGSRDVLLFNLEELKEWRDEYRRGERRRRGEAISKAQRWGYDEPYWESLAKDYVKGMSVKNIRVKYGAGEKRVRRFIEERSLVREKTRVPVGEVSPIVAKLREVTGLSFGELSKQLGVHEGTLREYMSPKKIASVAVDMYEKLKKALEDLGSRRRNKRIRRYGRAS